MRILRSTYEFAVLVLGGCNLTLARRNSGTVTPETARHDLGLALVRAVKHIIDKTAGLESSLLPSELD